MDADGMVYLMCKVENRLDMTTLLQAISVLFLLSCPLTSQMDTTCCKMEISSSFLIIQYEWNMKFNFSLQKHLKEKTQDSLLSGFYLYFVKLQLTSHKS